MTVKPALWRPVNPGACIPMPDRLGAIMPATGVVIDQANNYYRQLINDGDIEPAPSETKQAAPKAGRAQKSKG